MGRRTNESSHSRASNKSPDSSRAKEKRIKYMQMQFARYFGLKWLGAFYPDARGRLKIPGDRVGGSGGRRGEGGSKGPIESPQLKETPNYQSGATAISENDLT